MKRWILPLLLIAWFGVTLAVAGGASAHATVVTSSPADGARFTSAPATVSITFDEPVGLAPLGYLKVVDQTGRNVGQGSAFHPGGDGTKIAVKLNSGLSDGTYTESYRVISADSHPVAGTVRFVVGNGPLSAAVVSSTATDHVTTGTFDVVRWVSYAGFALLGGSWLLLTVWPEGRDELRTRRVLWAGWGLSVVGAVAQLALQGPYAAGSGLGRAFSWTLLDDTLRTDYGHALSVRLVLLGVVALLLGRLLDAGTTRRRGDVAWWPVLVGVAITFSVLGHPNTTDPRWVSIPADVLHVSAMAAWVGGLIMLVTVALPRGEADELQVVLPWFSRVAFTAVLVLAVTGTWAAWHGVGQLAAIFTTSYGVLVDIKIVLFLGLVGLGYLARRSVQRSVADGSTSVLTRERLRRGVLVELGVAAVVLAATSMLVAQPRGPETITARHASARSASAGLGGGRSATITVDPGIHGTVTVSLALTPGARPTTVTMTAALPSKDLGPITVPLAAQGTDLYGGSGVLLPSAGDWTFTVVVSTSQFDAVTADVTIHLY